MPGPVFLEGEAVTLRTVEREDLNFLQRAMNDPQVWRPSLDVEPTNGEQVEEFFETVLSESGDVHCLVCVDEAAIGIVSLTESQYGPDEASRARSAELAYWLVPEYHGRGYGSDAAARTVQYAFEDRNLRRVSARAGGFNAASAALLESLGFEREGIRREAAWYRGEYYDMLLYGLLRREWESDR